ncbi:electron transfer flavoprotein subunit beta/FixA family protein [Pigmentibacter sp. JX0631]|uniref:electron transfer flavoprotein subunit beta/FixA family protein n=1 Tax=Pigmentibacter sp. JX0631 TaxID=2976982 RepID=UPI002469AD7D|nr:electron transfer flavoprotein subunit beta/FixA family protein [Pigmentibacter sp. JX0631]WGL60726.1 electron transfer flavoprotein subunit beta/FixA family protein [Pigmentibacter sp. JX0631]
MKILVLAKHVPDTETVIKIASGGKAIDEADFKYMVNPCDEYAMEEAIRTQEKFKGESIVVSVGPSRAQETIRKALAMGIDRGVWINTEGFSNYLDSFTIASAIAKVVVEEKPDLIFAGLNTTDEGAGNVGPMVAEFAGMPSLVNISKIEWQNEGKSLKCERDVEGGIVEVYEAQLPLLIAPHQNLNDPRFPSLPGIMKAKKKPIAEKKASELITEKARIEVKNYKLPPEKAPGKIFKGKPVEEMVVEVAKLLRSEAKVI